MQGHPLQRPVGAMFMCSHYISNVYWPPAGSVSHFRFEQHQCMYGPDEEILHILGSFLEYRRAGPKSGGTPLLFSYGESETQLYLAGRLLVDENWTTVLDARRQVQGPMSANQKVWIAKVPTDNGDSTAR
jgi:hypothetical protein